jgi:pyruvate formate lyase activating enzyme
VVISGGEPLAQKQLPTLLQKIKKMGFFVKIDTNGTYPYRLKELLNQRLVDYVAMDIKAPFNKMYQQITDADVDLESIKESVRILLASNIDYELRTTLVPTFHKKEQIRQIAESIRGARRYVLQGFEPEGAREPSLRTLPPMEAEEVEEMIKEARRYIKDVRYRGRWSITRVQGSL